jgi:glycosyltransferase involved in cell wall biosynthesis
VKRDLAQILPGVLVTVILNAIDVDHFCPASADGQMLDQLAGLPAAQPGTLRVGLVATYARWKGHEVFLQAAARVCSEAGSFPVRFYIVGGPIYLTSAQFSNDELRQMTRDLGLEGRVGFVPFQSDTLQTYRCLDIVVHASTKPEPFGLTIVEAMACGRAVIVAKAGGAAELFQSDEDAVGVPPGNVAALAAAIAGLLHDSEKRTRLGQAARRSAVARFDRSRLGPEVLNFYKSVLGSGGQCAERDALVRT